MRKFFYNLFVVAVALLASASPVQAAVNFTVNAMNSTADGATVKVAPNGSFENATKFPNINITMAEYGATVAGSTLSLTSDKGYSKDIEINSMFYEMEYGNDIIVKISNEEITESGVYTLHVPAGFLTLNGESNEAADFVWTYTNSNEQGGGDETQLELTSFTVKTSNMLAENPALDQITSGDPIVININPIPEAVMLTLAFNDKDGNTIRRMEIYDNQYNKNIEVDPAKGKYKTVVAGKSVNKFFIDTEYTAVITGYSSNNANNPANKVWGPVEVKFTGTSEPYKFSEAKIVSITPTTRQGSDISTPTAEISDVTTPIVVTFSAPVESVKCTASEGGQGASTYTFTDIKPNADKTIWTIYPGSFWKSAAAEYMFMISAKDANGRVVEGTNGVEAGSYTTAYYGCYLTWPAVSILPATGMIEELYEFTVNETRCVGFNGTGKPYVVNENGETVATADLNSQVQYDAQGRDISTLPMGDYKAVKMTFNLDKAITEPGKYTLCVPRATFAIGSGYDADFNRYMEIEYQVVKMPKQKINVELVNFAKTSFEVLEGRDATVSLQPAADWTLASLTLNGKDVTADVVDNAYTLKKVAEESSLIATYEFAHEVDVVETTGIVSVENHDYTISNVDGFIQIENLKAGDVVKVYTVNGMSVAQMTASKDVMKISAPTGQVYVVMINGAAVKVKH